VVFIEGWFVSHSGVQHGIGLLPMYLNQKKYFFANIENKMPILIKDYYIEL